MKFNIRAGASREDVLTEAVPVFQQEHTFILNFGEIH